MIIWLASYPKSGNTLLRSILSTYFYSQDGVLQFENLNKISQFPQTHHFLPLGIDVGNEKEVFKNFINAQNFLNELGNPYKTILLDEDGTISIEWGAYGVPETFLIYKNKIVAKYIGPLNEELINEINSILK